MTRFTDNNMWHISHQELAKFFFIILQLICYKYTSTALPQWTHTVLHSLNSASRCHWCTAHNLPVSPVVYVGRRTAVKPLRRLTQYNTPYIAQRSVALAERTCCMLATPTGLSSAPLLQHHLRALLTLVANALRRIIILLVLSSLLYCAITRSVITVVMPITYKGSGLQATYDTSQWRNWVGSALRQTFPRRPKECKNYVCLTWGTQAIELPEASESS